MPRIVRERYIGSRRHTVFLLPDGRYAVEIWIKQDTPQGLRWVFVRAREFPEKP